MRFFQFLYRSSATDSLQSAHAVHDYHSVAVIGLVLPYPSQQSVSLLLEILPLQVLGSNLDLTRPFGLTGNPRG